MNELIQQMNELSLMLPLPQDCVQLNQYKLQSEIGKVRPGQEGGWGAVLQSPLSVSIFHSDGTGEQSQEHPA